MKPPRNLLVSLLQPLLCRPPQPGRTAGEDASRFHLSNVAQNSGIRLHEPCRTKKHTQCIFGSMTSQHQANFVNIDEFVCSHNFLNLVNFGQVGYHCLCNVTLQPLWRTATPLTATPRATLPAAPRPRCRSPLRRRRRRSIQCHGFEGEDMDGLEICKWKIQENPIELIEHGFFWVDPLGVKICWKYRIFAVLHRQTGAKALMEELPEDATKETEAAKKQRHLELARSAQLRQNWGSVSVCKTLPLAITCLRIQKIVSYGLVSIYT